MPIPYYGEGRVTPSHVPAEGVGFEPTRPCDLAHFKCAGMNHYPTPPASIAYSTIEPTIF